MKKTSKQWWDEMKIDSAKFNNWLLKQYRGEVTASVRIAKITEKYANEEDNNITADQILMLKRIAGEESKHASWVRDLCHTRGLNVSEVNLTEAEDRYWKKTLPAAISFNTAMAIGAHAEKMRLERINTIVEDVDAPEDVRNVFSKILIDEIRHEEDFRSLAGDRAMKDTLPAHSLGRALLGLTP